MSALDGLNATDAELADLIDVLAETGDVEGLSELYADMDGPADPADYELDAALAAEAEAAEADLSSSGYDLSQLADIGQQIDLAGETAAQRYAEDAAGMPMATEDRTAHLLSRVDRGTYTPAQPMRDDIHGCGPLDDFGRCSSRYHAGTCFETARGEAATGSAPAIEAWRDQLLSNHGHTSALQLANEADAAELEAAGRQVHDVSTYGAMRGILGIRR